MKTNPTSDLEPHREPPSRPRFANTMNLWSFWFWAITTATQAFNYDLNLQKPTPRLGLFATGLLAGLYLILAIQERLEQRITTLLDRLEQKGVLSAEERATIGIVPPKIIEVAAVWRALIVVAVVFIALLFLFFIAT